MSILYLPFLKSGFSSKIILISILRPVMWQHILIFFKIMLIIRGKPSTLK